MRYLTECHYFKDAYVSCSTFSTEECCDSLDFMDITGNGIRISGHHPEGLEMRKVPGQNISIVWKSDYSVTDDGFSCTLVSGTYISPSSHGNVHKWHSRNTLFLKKLTIKREYFMRN